MRLNARRAFVKAHDADIARHLFEFKIFGIAVAAENLDTLIDRQRPHFRTESLSNGRQKLQKSIVMFRESLSCHRLCVVVVVRFFQIEILITL